MYPTSISAQYEKLPDNYKQEANDFIEFLFSKVNKNQNIVKEKALKRNGFGCLKGKIKMADDFDAPLDDFKDYM